MCYIIGHYSMTYFIAIVYNAVYCALNNLIYASLNCSYLVTSLC